MSLFLHKIFLIRNQEGTIIEHDKFTQSLTSSAKFFGAKYFGGKIFGGRKKFRWKKFRWYFDHFGDKFRWDS